MDAVVRNARQSTVGAAKSARTSGMRAQRSTRTTKKSERRVSIGSSTPERDSTGSAIAHSNSHGGKPDGARDNTAVHGNVPTAKEAAEAAGHVKSNQVHIPKVVQCCAVDCSKG